MKLQTECFTTCFRHKTTVSAMEEKHKTFLHFFGASDASFDDNTLDQKSSQGYIMKLFGGAIAWRANK